MPREPPGREPVRISVIVPVHNAAGLLRHQLDALAAQDYTREWEVIVADNGSTDETIAVAESYVERLPGVRVVDASDRRGAAHARNLGTAAARGDFFLFCDADDEAAPGWVSAMAKAAQGAHIVGGPLEEGKLNDALVRAWRPAQRFEEGLPTPLGFLPAAASANMAIWSDVFRALGGWREDYVGGSEDTEFCWRAQLHSYRMGYAADAAMHYRHRSGLRDLARQYLQFGSMNAKLYRDFRGHGMPRSSVRTALGATKWLLRHLPHLWGSNDQKGAWVQLGAYHAGRMLGSLRYRVVYL